MLKRIVLLLLICLLSASGAFAADPLIAEIQNAYEKMKTFSGSFTQELKHRETASSERRTGTLLFKKPLFVRWETASPFPELLVINTNEVWDYLPDEEVAYRHNHNAVHGSKSIIQVVTGQSRLDKDFDVEREADQNGLAVIRLYPKEPSTQLVEALLAVDPATKLLRSAETVDFYGNINRITFSQLTPNAPAPAEAFSFTPPKGVTVEDRRKEK